MAEADNTQSRARADTTDGPVLRPGRPADAAPAGGSAAPVGISAASTSSSQANPHATPPTQADQLPAAGTAAPATSEDPGESGGEEQDHPEVPDDARTGSDPEQAVSRQRWLRQLLRQCDRVLLLDFNLLAMPDWPDNYTLATARRNRDLWLFSLTLAGLVFLSGLSGFVPAWIAGGGFGAGVLITLAGVPGIRRLYSNRLSHVELLMLRRRLLRDARRHIEHLEGDTGLVWQCGRMAEFNPALRSPRFTALINLSERRVLARALRRREHIRMYLIYLLEAEKAYHRLERAYFEGHQQAIDEGWESAAGTPGQP